MFILQSVSPLSFVFSKVELPMCRLYRAYQKLYTLMHDRGTGPHKTQFRRDEDYGESHKKKLVIII